ncbi:MAG: hypothetical protein GY769_20160 [bacterium]|nr:hypothetical protein [bacterium]
MKYTVTLLVEVDEDDPSRVLDEVTSAIEYEVDLDQEAVDAGNAVTVEERHGGDPPVTVPVDVAFDLLHDEVKARSIALNRQCRALVEAAEALDAKAHRTTVVGADVDNVRKLAVRVGHVATTIDLLRALQTELEKQCK